MEKGTKALNSAIETRHKLNEKGISPKKMDQIYHEYIKLLKKAAYLGNIEALFEYGASFGDLTFRGVNPHYNPKKCVYWYTKACNMGHAEACNNLANLYENGEGCEKDIQKAQALYKKAADLGSKNAKGNYKLITQQIATGYYTL